MQMTPELTDPPVPSPYNSSVFCVTLLDLLKRVNEKGRIERDAAFVFAAAMERRRYGSLMVFPGMSRFGERPGFARWSAATVVPWRLAMPLRVSPLRIL